MTGLTQRRRDAKAQRKGILSPLCVAAWRTAYRRSLALWTLFFVGLVFLTGCLTSPNPFYSQSDVIQDNRIVGDYYPQSDTRFRIEKDRKNDGRYIVRVTEGSTKEDHWIEFAGTLFKLGTNTYLDLNPRTNSAPLHIPGNPPTLTEMLHAITHQSLHLVVRVCFSDKGVGISVAKDRGLFALARKAGLTADSIREEVMRLDLPTAELRKILAKAEGDDVFPVPSEFTQPKPLKDQPAH